MKIALCYPPIPSPKGTPLLSQNRQFQWFSRPTAIYPVVPASAATLLRAHGHEVLWLDGIARGMTPEAFWRDLEAWRPDAVFVETKTPVVRFHWRWVAELKRRLPGCLAVMAGDHVNALPDETLANAPVDAVLRGGDYDFALLDWAEGRATPTPVDLAALPRIDRALTRWRDYAFRNGNFARTPGAYVMSARDCWHGRCAFCSWAALYPTYRVRPVGQVLDELGHLADLGAREVMDDAGSQPTGAWLRAFCEGLLARGLHKRLRIDCNQRFGALGAEDYRLMRRSGYRMVLFGVESANQETLDRLGKGLTLEQIREGARLASEAGLDVHVTLMFGYPWETYADARRTAALGRELLRRGHAASLQATWLVPYPGTPLFRELRASGQLLTEDWDAYDMRGPVMRSPLTEAEIRGLIAWAYRGHLQPRPVLRALTRPAFVPKAARALFSHLRDFRAPTP